MLLLSGCRGLVSEMQKSTVNSASSSVTVGGSELRLSSALQKSFHPDGAAFDLAGTLTVESDGQIPADVRIYHMTLRPSWKGWPGYYLLNFREDDGIWHGVGQMDFYAGTRSEAGKLIVQFTLSNQGGRMGNKPEHFVAYDVSVDLTDAAGHRYTMANLAVPTE